MCEARTTVRPTPMDRALEPGHMRYLDLSRPTPDPRPQCGLGVQYFNALRLAASAATSGAFRSALRLTHAIVAWLPIYMRRTTAVGLCIQHPGLFKPLDKLSMARRALCFS